jgi:hypothetical protein
MVAAAAAAQAQRERQPFLVPLAVAVTVHPIHIQVAR